MISQEAKTAVQAATDRVSVRKYEAGPLTTTEIEKIVSLASKAPSPFNIQPWRFLVATSQELKDKLQGAAYGQPQVGGAQAVIVLASDMDDALSHFPEYVHPGMPEDKKASTIETVNGIFKGSMDEAARNNWGKSMSYIALGYLLLVLESLGYGSSPMSGFEEAKVKEVLGLGPNVQIAALVAFGRPAEDGFRPQFRAPLEHVMKLLD